MPAPTPSPTPSPKLSAEQLDVLKGIADYRAKHERPPTTAELAKFIRIRLELVEYHLTELNDSGLVYCTLSFGAGAIWYLDQKGRGYLIAQGLLK